MTTKPKLNFLEGNSVTPLANADEAYSAMLKAIHHSQKTIYFAHFCVNEGKISDLFFQPLLRAARRGVQIYYLIDPYGSKQADQNQLEKMALDGIQIVWFNPLERLRPWRYNKRMHKKLLVVDDEIGFTGGIGVADFWTTTPDYLKPWRDVHFQLVGSIVGEMSHSFIRSWNRSSSHPLTFESSQPQPLPSGVPAALVDSSPLEPHHPSVINDLFTSLIDEAQTSITITTAFFGPTSHLIKHLTSALDRGVSLRLIVNGPYPIHTLAMHAGRFRYAQILKAGGHIYEYQDSSIHTKLMVIDGQLSVIGSTNLNTRSFKHDEEINVVIDDPNLAGALSQLFEEDLTHSQEITLKAWQKRPLPTKLRQAASSLGRYFF